MRNRFELTRLFFAQPIQLDVFPAAVFRQRSVAGLRIGRTIGRQGGELLSRKDPVGLDPPTLLGRVNQIIHQLGSVAMTNLGALVGIIAIGQQPPRPVEGGTHGGQVARARLVRGGGGWLDLGCRCRHLGRYADPSRSLLWGRIRAPLRLWLAPLVMVGIVRPALDFYVTGGRRFRG